MKSISKDHFDERILDNQLDAIGKSWEIDTPLVGLFMEQLSNYHRNMVLDLSGAARSTNRMQPNINKFYVPKLQER